MLHPATFLRRVLVLDAISCAAMGIALVAGAAVAAPLIGVPATPLEGAGVALLGFAVFIGWLARHDAPPAAGVWVVIIGNTLWVVDSLLLAAGLGAQPTTLGSVLVGGQALAVATLAELEYVGLKRLRLREA